MKLKKIWIGLHWLTGVTIGFLAFLSKNPRAALPTFKFILLNLHTIPRRLQYTTRFDEEQARIDGELSRCSAYFDDVKIISEGAIDIKELDRSSPPSLRPWGLLYMLIRALKPNVVETGVAEGRSTSHILQAMADNSGGFLYSIDLPNHFYLSKRELCTIFNPLKYCLVPLRLENRWQLILGNTWDTLLGLLTRLGEIDLFLHDSAHTYETMTFEFETAWPHIRPGGYLVSDDAASNASLSDFTRRHNVNLIILGGQGFIRKPEEAGHRNPP